MKIRVPNAQFDALVNVIESGVGKVTSKSLKAKDVTEEYLDLNVRLENKIAYLMQYKVILKKANTIKEILEVQEKIRHIEEEIESKKGRLQYLDDKVNFSTLNMTITQVVSSQSSIGPGFGQRIAKAFSNGVQGFLGFVVGLVSVWPFVILLIILLLGRKRIFRLFKKDRR